jgi:hypothetical protein
LITLAETVTAVIGAMNMQKEYLSGAEISKMHIVVKGFAIMSSTAIANEGIFCVKHITGSMENAS